MRIMEAGIPALGRGPFECERKIGLCHDAYNETLGAHRSCFPQLSFAAATSPSVT